MEASKTETNNSLLALSQGLAAAVERVAPAVVAVNARPRVATSGVHWRQGIVVSTNHTVRQDEEITVMLHGGRTISAALAGRDPSTDLAVLRLDEGAAATDYEAIEFTDAAELKAGHLVLAVGRVSEHGVSASFGAVSATGDAWRTWRGGEIDRLIRLDLAIYLGFSGGALVDAGGRILGINTSGLSRGAGLTIPASTVNRVVNRILEKGTIRRGYLGVGGQPINLPESMRTALNLPASSGLIIVSVEPDGPAGKAGMLIGDVLIALNDAPVGDTDDVQGALGPERVGQQSKASIVRGGARTDLIVTVGERPPRGR